MVDHARSAARARFCSPLGLLSGMNQATLYVSTEPCVAHSSTMRPRNPMWVIGVVLLRNLRNDRAADIVLDASGLAQRSFSTALHLDEV
jgi:hypothetical protein